MKINDSNVKNSSNVSDLKSNMREPFLVFKRDNTLIVKTPGQCRLNVRTKPTIKSTVLTTVACGEPVDVQWIDEKEWVKVKTSNNIVGYCLLSFLDTAQE